MEDQLLLLLLLVFVYSYSVSCSNCCTASNGRLRTCSNLEYYELVSGIKHPLIISTKCKCLFITFLFCRPQHRKLQYKRPLGLPPGFASNGPNPHL